MRLCRQHKSENFLNFFRLFFFELRRHELTYEAYSSIDVFHLQGFVSDARAYWVTRSLIAWNVNDQDTSLFLYASRDATMHVSDGAIHGR